MVPVARDEGINGNDIESRFVHHGYIAKHGEPAEPAEAARRAWKEFWSEVDLMAEGIDRSGSPIARDYDGSM